MLLFLFQLIITADNTKTSVLIIWLFISELYLIHGNNCIHDLGTNFKETRSYVIIHAIEICPPIGPWQLSRYDASGYITVARAWGGRIALARPQRKRTVRVCESSHGHNARGRSGFVRALTATTQEDGQGSWELSRPQRTKTVRVHERSHGHNAWGRSGFVSALMPQPMRTVREGI
jgi:hypothetical protein